MNQNKSETAASGSPRQSGANGWVKFILKWAWVILPLAYLWFRTINNLRVEWENSPQYSYGLVVPLLVVGLLFRRCLPAVGRDQGVVASHPKIAILMAVVCAFFYLPTTLIEGATPEWRPIQWMLALETVGLTLSFVYLTGGRSWLRRTAFAIVFFLVAVPWPSLIEQPIIQGLSRMNAGFVVDVMALLNVPAIQHGNVVQVSTGMVGISDACSGIRSFQSSLMISLFMGEFYLFSWRRRTLLVPISFSLAMFLNVVRASILTWIAAADGIAAIAIYHDETGLTILLICTALLWLVAWLMNHRQSAPGMEQLAASVKPAPAEVTLTPARLLMARTRANRLGAALAVWLVAVWGGVALWYHVQDSGFKPGPAWTVNFPTNNPTFKQIPLTDAERVLLRFDSGKKGQWDGRDGRSWEVFYFNWKPGRVAAYLAKRHTPDICMTAVGYKMVKNSNLFMLKVKGIDLPIRHYVFDSSDGKLQVYQCRWDADERMNNYTADESSRFNLIRGVWAGRGDKGQKVIEVIISGCANAQQGRQALQRELPRLITLKKKATYAHHAH